MLSKSFDMRNIVLLIGLFFIVSSCTKQNATSPVRTYHFIHYYSKSQRFPQNAPPGPITTIDSALDKDELLTYQFTNVIFRGDTFQHGYLGSDSAYQVDYGQGGVLPFEYSIRLNSDSILVTYTEANYSSGLNSFFYQRKEWGYWKK